MQAYVVKGLPSKKVGAKHVGGTHRELDSWIGNIGQP
jgi:hypothetical protein